MRNRIILGVVMVVAIVAARLNFTTQTLPAADGVSYGENEKTEEDNKQNISVDVLIEEWDLSANTITARATIHVVPPHDSVGGRVSMTGTTGSHSNEATRYVRLPVMPEANLKEMKLEVDRHATLRLEMLRPGALVVVGIDEFAQAEKIGVEWLDAPGTKESK